MKKLFFALMLMVATLSVSANEVRYFTTPQAIRTVTYLNAQNELMIYCGYPNELPTYVIISEVWYESVNPQYNEVWIFGYDAYTGEEIFMPIDLGCVWLFSGTHIYSAAQVLRFRSNYARPTFAWAMPHYHPFHRGPHPVVYHRTYHYDVHIYGWDPFHTPHPGMPHYHPYYMRHINEPAPMPPIYTPGIEQPTVSRRENHGANEPGYEYVGSSARSGATPTSPVTTTTTRQGSNPSGNTTPSRSANNPTSSSRSNTQATSSRSGSEGTTSSRSGVESSSNSSRTSGTGTTTSGRSGNDNSGNSSRGSSTSTSSSSRGTSSASTSSSSRSSNSSATTSSSTRSNTPSTNTVTKSRTSTSTSNSSSRSSATSSSSSSRTSSTANTSSSSSTRSTSTKTTGSTNSSRTSSNSNSGRTTR